jgi:hypothetical protein
VGGSGSAQVAVNSLTGFNSAVTLSVSWVPPGVTTSLSANPVTPPSGGTASSTLNFSLSPAVTPSTFIVRVIGISGSLTHSTDMKVTVVADIPSIENVLNQISSAGCINNAQVLQSLAAKLAAAQNEVTAGQIQWAANTLRAIIFELPISYCARHFSGLCKLGGAEFNPTAVLVQDAAAVIITLKVNPDPIMGYVVNSSDVGIPGAAVSLLT